MIIGYNEQTELSIARPQILQLFVSNLPKHPYCTDDLTGGLQIRAVEYAIKKRIIQYNKPTEIGFLCYDIDHETNVWDDFFCNSAVPLPNIVCGNRENGHCHVLYALETPVYQQAGARANPLRYVAAVDTALTEALQADPQYAKLVCKNPCNIHWQTYILRDEPYDLPELAGKVDLNLRKLPRRKLPDVGLGRNCNLFDTVRIWAYRAIRWADRTYFVDACINYAREHNTFSVPLPDKECETIGKSVGRWVVRHYSEKGFSQWQAAQGRKSGKVRAASAQDKAELVRAYKAEHTEASVRQIAEAVGIPYRSVARYLQNNEQFLLKY